MKQKNNANHAHVSIYRTLHLNHDHETIFGSYSSSGLSNNMQIMNKDKMISGNQIFH
jgi:hypothetical protein